MDSKLPRKRQARLKDAAFETAHRPKLSAGPLAVGAAITTVAIVGVGLSLSLTLLALRLAEQGYSGGAIGLNSAAGGLATFAIAPFVPALARRLGVRRLLIFSILAGALSLAAFAATDGYWPWLAIRTLFGAALTILFAVSEFWISSAALAGRRGLVMGLYTASFALGIALGPSILAVTGTQGSAPFLAAIALFLLAGLPIAVLGTSAPVLERPARISVLAFVAAMPAATCAALVYGAIETTAMGLLPVYALRSGLGAATGALLVTIFALGNGAFQTPIGIVSDRFDRRRLLMLVAGFGTIGALLLPLAREAGFAAFASLLFVWGGVVGSLYAIGLAYLGSRYQGAELASGNAAYIMLYSAGMLAGPPLTGLGLDLAPAGLFIALALLLAGYFALASWRGS
jgi:MFS family permease